MLDIIEKKNPELVRTAVELHQNGDIAPNTYLIDLDAVKENAREIKKCGDRYGIEQYVMTKQCNRNPSMIKAFMEEGLDKAVAVDIICINNLQKHDMALGHVGHLVQVPRHQVKRVLKFSPEVWTVYGYENAGFISEGAEKLGMEQDLLVKVIGPKDVAYTSQEGGIPLDRVVEEAEKINKLPGVNVAGTTGFPTILFDEESNSVKPVPNLKSVVEGAKRIENELGIEVKQVNCPGTSSCATMEVIKNHGGTHAEPGSALWGMAPQQLVTGDHGIPAQVYVTEVSHFSNGKASVQGGGFVSDDLLEGMAVREAFVGTSAESILENRVKAKVPDTEIMAYHTWLFPESDEDVRVGDTAVYFFRPQAFCTRFSDFAAVSGIKENNPKLEAIYDQGNQSVSYKN